MKNKSDSYLKKVDPWINQIDINKNRSYKKTMLEQIITQDWIKNPATQAVCNMLTANGKQAFFVGGCVRNALMGIPVIDIDMATNAEPYQVMKLARNAGLEVIPTGIFYGTVTVMSDDIPHEITTFRNDMKTDGRHATVMFSETIEEDAKRRDFTMNALYADPDGRIFDPLNGLPDLKARQFRFIGKAEDRIREDYLRSLRYFRFHAWYGFANTGFDRAALTAIAANPDGLKYLSRERISSEMLKILAAPDPVISMAELRKTGVLERILPGASDDYLSRLVVLERDAQVKPDPIRRLSAITNIKGALTLRLPKVELKRLKSMRKCAMCMANAAELGYRYGIKAGLDMLLLRAAFQGQNWNNNAYEDLSHGAEARFPVQSEDLVEAFSGPALGAKLSQLEMRWIASDFRMTREQLLAGQKSLVENNPDVQEVGQAISSESGFSETASGG